MAKDFIQLLSLRLLSVLLIQTAYVPDEYWQSLEIGHYLTFGYGHLTWEWQEGLRSYLYPGLISAIFYLLKFFNLDNVNLLVTVPRVLQAILTAYADLRLLNWIKSPQYKRAPWAKITVVSSAYWFYVGSRTLYNTMETDLTAIAFTLYPWPPTSKSEKSIYLFPAALACMIRPTAALIWLPLCVYHLATTSTRLKIFATNILVGASAVGLGVLVDYQSSQRLTFSAWNFVRVNALQGVSSWYGINPTTWYVTHGLPMMLGLHLLPCLYEIVRILRNPKRDSYEKLILFVIFLNVILYSLLPHKETRFLLPLLPLFFFLAAGGLAHWEAETQKKNLGRFDGVVRKSVAAVPWLLLIGLSVSSFYFGLIHQRGTLDVMPWLSKRVSECPKKSDLLFLMPCHSTPLYSHLHVNIPTRILTCVPDLGSQPNPNYRDEADIFYEEPLQWLIKSYVGTDVSESFSRLLGCQIGDYRSFEGVGKVPSHIIAFDVLRPKIASFLQKFNFTLAATFEHTHFPTDRVGSNVVVFERSGVFEGC